MVITSLTQRYGYAVMGGGGMGGIDPSAGETGSNFITNYLATLPPWASALVYTLVILAAAWIAGIFLGRIYASIRYPDPEKHSVLPPKVKAVFLALMVIVSIILYQTISKTDEPNADSIGGDSSYGDPGSNDGMTDEDTVGNNEAGLPEGGEDGSSGLEDPPPAESPPEPAGEETEAANPAT